MRHNLSPNFSSLHNQIIVVSSWYFLIWMWKQVKYLIRKEIEKKDNLCQGQESHFAYLSSYSVKSWNLLSTVLWLTTVNCIYLFCLKHPHINWCSFFFNFIGVLNTVILCDSYIKKIKFWGTEFDEFISFKCFLRQKKQQK